MQHYAHLAPDFFGAKAFGVVTVDLAQPKGDVVALRDVSDPFGLTMVTTQQANAAEQLSLIV